MNNLATGLQISGSGKAAKIVNEGIFMLDPETKKTTFLFPGKDPAV